MKTEEKMEIKICINSDENLPHPWELAIEVEGSFFHSKTGRLGGVENAFDTKEELIGYVIQLISESINKYDNGDHR